MNCPYEVSLRELMNTTDLFNFKFVDREDERKKFDSYFRHWEENVLWIKGNRGYGKTQLVNYICTKQKEFEVCYIDIKIGFTSTDIFSNLLIELQKFHDTNFMDYIKKNYKAFYNQVYKKTEDLTTVLFPDISYITKIITSLGYYAITYSDERKNPIDLIIDYMEKILDKKKLFICIDNFSRINLETAKIFFEIFKKFLYNKNFRGCIITTTEDLNQELKLEILKFLPFEDIEICKFDKYDFFYQILDPIFDLHSFTEKDMEYLWFKCEGSPKKLSTIISKLMEKHGIIIYKSQKAQIDKKVFFTILQESHIRFKSSDFNIMQKWVLFSYLCFNESANIDILRQLAIYITQKCIFFNNLKEDIFKNTLLELIENKILFCSLDGVISSCHDADYIELRDIFNESNITGIVCQCAYEFFLQQPKFSEQEDLLCRHARLADIIGWEKRVFNYGKKLYNNGQIYEAQNNFMYLSKSLHKFHPIQILRLAIASYETGNYHLAIEQLLSIAFDKLRFYKVKYFFYYYNAKSYNNIGKVKEASEFLKLALNEVQKDSSLYVQALNLLQLYYYEIPEKLSDAERIFNKIRNSYRTKFPELWAKTIRGCQNYVDNETAKELLSEAQDILSDELEKAFLENTQGFVFIKSDCLFKAEDCFRNAYYTIKKLKIHECSYAASNLAICYMMRKEFDKATEILLQAICWNRTNYGDIVLQTHLMVCYTYLGMKKEAEQYYTFLTDYMDNNSPVDSILKRKVFMNLAIISSKLDYPLLSQIYYKKAEPYILGSSSEWRYNELVNIMNNNEGKIPQYYKVTDFDPWFLVYAHD